RTHTHTHTHACTQTHRKKVTRSDFLLLTVTTHSVFRVPYRLPSFSKCEYRNSGKHTHTHTYTQTHRYTLTHAHTQKHTDTHMFEHNTALTYAHTPFSPTYTHTHTYTQQLPCLTQSPFKHCSQQSVSPCSLVSNPSKSRERESCVQAE